MKVTPEHIWTGASWKATPHSVLEGLIIAAYAIGASKGYIYVRQEYPLAVENVRAAIKEQRNMDFWEKIYWVQVLILR